jgi:Kdo2-lipid IVA lauroyltransferase/acyltransferase
MARSREHASAMPSAPAMTRAAPPLRWLFADAPRRAQAWRYWCVDTAAGLYNAGLHHAMRALPIDACSSVGAFFTLYSPRLYRASDARARRAWCRLRPDEAAPAAVDAAMKRLWRCVNRTMAEFSVLHRLWDAGRISVTGLEHLAAARAAGRPLLVAVLHLGNWETVLIAGIRSGFPGSGIYLPLDNRFDRHLATRARDRYRGGQIPAGPGALRAALQVLREKREPFVIFIDELARGRVQAPLFGRAPRADSNIAYAARLAAMTGAALIPAYCRRLGDEARFAVEFLPPVEIVTGADHDAPLAANVARINAAIEPVIRDHLDQWYFLLDLDLGAESL